MISFDKFLNCPFVYPFVQSLAVHYFCSASCFWPIFVAISLLILAVCFLFAVNPLKFPEITDSLCVSNSFNGRERVVLFLKMNDENT